MDGASDVRTSLRGVRAQVGVAALGSVALLTLGAATGRSGWPIYAAVVALGGVGAGALHHRIGLSGVSSWGLVAFALGHLAGGLVPVGDGILYQVWLVDGVVRYDNLQHAVGFGIVGRVTWEALRPRLRPAPGDLGPVAWWLVVLGACAAGAVNEVVEYGITLVVEDHAIGGYDNTARDLVANLVGGLVAATATARAVTRGT